MTLLVVFLATFTVYVLLLLFMGAMAACLGFTFPKPPPVKALPKHPTTLLMPINAPGDEREC